MKTMIVTGCLWLLLTGATDQARGAQVLSDEEMDQVTAGTLSVGMTDGKLNFLLGGDKGGRLSVEGSGTVAAAANNLPAGPPGYIVMRDNAQANLQALVNVTAVNSKVQVLINLTVNINSTVGAIYQTNSVPSP
jgi:hypothetical protein